MDVLGNFKYLLPILGAERSNALLKTNLTGVTLESCNASLLGYNANDRSLRNGVNLGQICAYDPQARQDSCEVGTKSQSQYCC